MKRILIFVIWALGVVQVNVAWSEDLTTITLDEALVFSAPNGDVVNVVPGHHVLALSEADGLSLTPHDGEAVIVQAIRQQHEMDVTAPIARVIPSKDEATYTVVLVLPDGEYARAVGSREGVSSRGVDPRVRKQQLLIAMGHAPARPISAKIPNVALKKKAKQSSRYKDAYATKAVDGITNGNLSARSLAHTRKERNPWWEVDLGTRYNIMKIEIWNRTDCCAERLDRLSISISNKSGAAGQPFFVGSRRYNPRAGNPLTFYGTKTGRFVRVNLHAINYLTLAEVKVFGVKPPPPPDVASGWWHTCVVSNAMPKCWGYNWSGSTVPPTGVRFHNISAGQKHTCGLKTNGEAQCWGNNDWQQSSPPSGVRFKNISSGNYFNCGVRRSDSQVQCWGTNSQGQSDPPDGVKFLRVAAGSDHACGIRKSDARVQCWGGNPDAAAYGHTTPPSGVAFSRISSGSKFTCGIRKSDANVQCWGSDQWGAVSSPGGVKFSSISAGKFHMCGIRKNDGTAQCWGLNSHGQEDSPAGVAFTILSAGHRHTCGMRKNDGKAQCWGMDNYGQSSQPQ